MPEIATVAGVGRTTLHRYFADRETLIYEATLDSIRVLTEAVHEAATDDGPAVDAMRRFITAAVSVGERLVFLFGDPAVLRDIPPAQSPNEELLINLDRPGGLSSAGGDAVAAALAMGAVEEARADLADETNLNARLVLERMFLRLSEL